MFVHLRVRSGYSFLFGAFTLKALLEKVKELGMDSIALTDRNGLYGAVKFYQLCRKEGIKPVIGMEAPFEDGSLIVLLAKDFSGYKNLCRLISKVNLHSKGTLSLKLLHDYSGGIYCLTGGREGKIWRLITLGKVKEAEKFSLELKSIFWERLFIEVQNHGLKGDREMMEALISLSRRLRIPPVATNSVTFLKKEDFQIHRILVEIQRVIHHRKVYPLPSDQFYLKTKKEMKKAIAFSEPIENAAALARSINLHLPLGKLHPPGNPAEEFLRLSRLCYQNLSRKYRFLPAEVIKRLDHELSLIKERGYSSYFLVAHHIFEFARSKGIRCSIRGSAAGSLVSYLLFGGIDPIEHGLLFERFLNDGRFDPPDIDLDFDSERREEVMAYTLERYEGKAALVATIPTFRARSALREIGRTFGYSYPEISELTRFVPYHLSPSDIPEALRRLPELSDSPLQDEHKLIELAFKLDGLPRQLSVHLGGVVISEELADLVPLELSPRGFPLSQYDKDDLEALGITRFDLLGLRMHTAISKTLAYLQSKGIELDLESIPLDDCKTYELLRSTETVGVFQVESPGQRQLLGRLQPRTFSDIVIEISLFRPGPMEAKMIDPYLKRRSGKEAISYPHPSLKPILKETYGVLIFQEQVLRVIQELTGLGLDWADDFRRSMKANRPREEMEALKEKFVSACLGNGIDKELAEEVWRQVSAFASYGFCKAHAACFAIITYQSAYLKANYPLEFYLGLLNSGPVGSYPHRVILNEARRRFPVFPPHVNFSDYGYKEENGGIRVGFSVIKGLGPKMAARIIKERNSRGPFLSLPEFERRTRIPARTVEALLQASAFEGVEEGSLWTERSFQLPLLRRSIWK
ncbi:MAG: hypothetical protein DRG25_02215 [Deltaproteobacteria bacterium]|nr:MAG: hypothetical protein DRG25_02215 [Deltaproteobacteria bacterium]